MHTIDTIHYNIIMSKLKSKFDEIDWTYCTVCGEESKHMISAEVHYLVKANGHDVPIETYRPYCSIDCMNQDSRLNHDEGESVCKHFENEVDGKYYCWQSSIPYRIHGSDCIGSLVACEECIVFEKCQYHPDLYTVYMKGDDSYVKCVH